MDARINRQRAQVAREMANASTSRVRRALYEQLARSWESAADGVGAVRGTRWPAVWASLFAH